MTNRPTISPVFESEFEREISVEFDKCKERVEASLRSPESEESNSPKGRKCFWIDKNLPLPEYQERAGALKTPEEHRAEWKETHADETPCKFAGPPVKWAVEHSKSKYDRVKEKILCCAVQ